MKKLLIIFFSLIIINNTILYGTTSEEIYELLDQVSLVRNMDELKELSIATVKYGKKYNIDPVLLISIVKTESSFVKDIQGPGNCWGYFQVNYNVHKVSQNFLNDTDEQTQKGAQVYNEFRKIFKNKHDSLNGYNGWVSDENQYAQKVINSYNKYKKIIKRNRENK